MKAKNILKKVALVSLPLFMASCEKDFLDINTNPNLPTSSTPELVLPSALANTGSVTNNDLNILGNLLSGHWAQSPDYLFYNAQETYQFTPSTYNATWVSLYSGGLEDYQYVDAEATKSGKKNLSAIAKIMQAYNYQLLVDAWGDVPFSESLQGTGNLAPKYEAATTVYDGILKLIDAGLASIDVSATADKPGTNDIVFAGNMDKWKRFANTLKLRVLLRQSLTASRASQVTAGFATLTGATFLGAGENAGTNPGYANQTGKFSPLYGAIGFTVTGAETSNFTATRGNKYSVDFVNATADPRVSLLFRPAKNSGNYVGVYPGTTATPTTKNADYSAVGPGILPASANNGFAKPAYLITATESYFLQAEAYLKGFLPGGVAAAQTAYQTGIEESFKLLGSTSAAAQAFYSTSANPLVNWTAATAANRQFEAVITQKWLALNGVDGFEAWSEFRRTGYPVNTPMPLNNISGGKHPLRIPYVQDEIGANSANVPQVDIFSTKIFWEQ
ncbi:SusD/RagB family nutrient-binding outer membrane lipoprotein [Pedobacter sp. HMF7647]|uniref:SusD/RagB family nutrient-binding outer membrane lipoprotein n=1 Tax=Hufsiella arboris TaxID=2695275 RepID=A0A7K1Y5N3_9SPHI|nr:SusD/RagB family nutrient-binding outer membrane lipoprotein [Hufsiella arboris]MXV49887.1 SusD/RagB family nutrient-binding outer membrane lipoprotein [Hufsiella arboris]